MSNHVVVCGYSGVAASVVDELRDRRVQVVIIDDRERVAQILRAKGHDVLEATPRCARPCWMPTSLRRKR